MLIFFHSEHVFDDFSFNTLFFELYFTLCAFVKLNFFDCFVLINFFKGSAVCSAFLVFRVSVSK